MKQLWLWLALAVKSCVRSGFLQHSFGRCRLFFLTLAMGKASSLLRMRGSRAISLWIALVSLWVALARQHCLLPCSYLSLLQCANMVVIVCALLVAQKKVLNCVSLQTQVKSKATFNCAGLTSPLEMASIPFFISSHSARPVGCACMALVTWL